ncbi:MAG TPA: hypothetical protein VG448_06455 [Solirubrobacterales bacterium]|nr:hypothetical protein [Solirubrobacterales bacterium]
MIEAEEQLRGLLDEEVQPYQRSFAREVEELAHEIEGTEPPPPHTPPLEPPTLDGLRGKEAAAARRRIEDVLAVDSQYSGINFPRRYARDMILAARTAKRSLELAKKSPKNQDRIPSVIAVLNQVIASLESTPPGGPSAREVLLDALRAVEDELKLLIGGLPDVWGGRPESHQLLGPDAVTLFGLKGERIRKARKVIEQLLTGGASQLGPSAPITSAERMVEAIESVHQILEPEREGTALNREKVPAVIDKLDILARAVRTAQQVAEKALGGAKGVQRRWRKHKSRGDELHRWQAVLSWSLNLLENAGQPVPAWQEITLPSLVAPLADLGEQQPQLRLRDAVVRPLDVGDLASAWVGLHDLVQAIEDGEVMLGRSKPKGKE